MKRVALYLLLFGLVMIPSAYAQEHVAVGAYADYFRRSQTNTNFGGLGGRFGFGVAPHLMLEAEMSYDFNQVFTEDCFSGPIISVRRSNLRLLHGLFGPKGGAGTLEFSSLRHFEGWFSEYPV